MDEIKANDFFATLVKNPDLSITDLRDNGINPSNSTMLSADEYKSMSQVQEAFKDDNGKFDEKKFTNAYNSAKVLYTNFAEDELFDNVMTNFTYGPDAWFAPGDAVRRDERPIIFTGQRASDISQGIKYITEAVVSPQELSIREIAQKEKVVDSETGETFDYSPNDKAGFFKRHELPTLVLASWDEDGQHDEDGVAVQHKKGDLKLNSNGRPYYETLGDREIYDKDVLRLSDILTVDGSAWNKVDIWDSDDVSKPGYKVALDLVGKVAPMFIPVVGEVYGYLGAASALVRVLPTLGKAVNGALGGADNVIDHSLNKWESWASRWDPTQSDKARENIVSWEGLAQMVSAVSGQLFQQKAVSTIPVLLGKARNSTNFAKMGQASKTLAFGYMAATSAQDIYGDFKRAGASDQMAGIGMLASAAALYKLMNIDYFRENILKDTFMDESKVRSAVAGASKETAAKIAESGTMKLPISTKKEAATLFNKISNWYKNSLLSSMNQKGIKGLAARGLSEGVEEVMEEVSTDTIKATTEALNALGINVTEEGKKLDFGWSGQDFLQRYLTSFGGGFIGGMIFAGQDRYSKWLHNLKYNITEMPVNDWQKLVYMVASGNRADIDYYLDKWHEKGILGSKDLSIDGKSEITADGTERFIPDSKGMSQNDAVYYTIKNTLDSIENALTKEVKDVRHLMTDAGMGQLQTLGYDVSSIVENPRLLTASAIAALEDYSSMQNDFVRTLSDIVKKKTELESRVKSLSEGKKSSTEEERKIGAKEIEEDETVKKLQEELKKLREKKDLIISGNENAYYADQAMFAADQVKQKPFVDVSKETYTRLLKGVSYESLNDTAKAEVDEAYKFFEEKEGRKKIYAAHDLYLQLQQKYAPIIQEHAEQLEKQFKEGKKSVEQILGYPEYIETSKKWKELKTQLTDLDAIPEEELTEDQKNEKKRIKTEMAGLNKRFTFMFRNPKLMLVTPNEGTKIDAFSGIVAEANPKLYLMDDYSIGLSAAKDSTEIVDPEIMDNIVKTLRDEYKGNIARGEYRFDDQELLTLYRGIVASYEKSGGAEERFRLYQNSLTSRYTEAVEEEGEISEIIPDEVMARFEAVPGGLFGAPRYYHDLIGALKTFTKNIGIDNTAAQRGYDRFIELIKTNTRLFEPGNEEELDVFMKTMIPHINGVSLVDIMHEFDEYRDKIRRSPIFDIMAQMGTDVKDVNLLQLIDQESKHLSTALSAEDYLIRNDAIKKSFSADSLKKTISVAMAVLESAADGTNDTVNNFKIKDTDKSIGKLATMSDKAYKVMREHCAAILDRIDFLRAISEGNNNRSLSTHKRTAINMRPKWVKAIVGIGELKDGEGKVVIDFQELWNSVTDDMPITPNEDDFVSWGKGCIKFEDAIYDALHEREDLPQLITSAFDTKSLYRSGSTKIGDDETIVPSAKDVVYHLATLASVPTSKFYSAWLASVDAYNEEAKAKGTKPLVSIYGQEYAGKQVIAQALNPELFNSILKIISDSADIDEHYPVESNKDTNPYLKHKPNLYNLATVLGSAGSGKTVGVIRMTLAALIGDSSDINITYLAKEQEQADKLAKSAGSPVDGYTINEFFEKVYGITTPEYVYQESDADESTTYHWRFKNPGKATPDNGIISKDGVRIIVIDEIETLNEPQLKRICDSARRNNIFVIGLGDLKQPGELLNGKNLKDSSARHMSGLDDCNFITTPTLTTSMRSETIAQSENTVTLAKPLETILEKLGENPGYKLSDADKDIASIISDNNKLVYYESESGELAGTMGVNSQEGFEEKIKSLSSLDGTVAIITDDTTGKYNHYAKDGKVFVVDYSKRAGGEWDYVLVDVDFKAKCNGSTYLLTQDFYTLTQRSRRGTVIKTSEATDTYNFVSDPTKAQNIAISAEQIKVYDEWRRQTFDGETFNINALQEYLDKSPLRTKVPPVAGTVVTPEPTGPAPTGPSSGSVAPGSTVPSTSAPSSVASTTAPSTTPLSTEPESPSGSTAPEPSFTSSSATSTTTTSTPSSPKVPELPSGPTLGPTSPESSTRSTSTSVSSSDSSIPEPSLAAGVPSESTSAPTSSTVGAPKPVSDPTTNAERAIRDFFYNDSGIPFNNLRLFKDLLIQLFPQAKLDRINTRGQAIYDKPWITRMEDYLANGVINAIREEIFKVYGQPGLDIFETILKNPGGFNSVEGEKIHEAALALKPVSKVPTISSKSTVDTSGRRRHYVDCNTTDYFSMLDTNFDNLFNWLLEQENPDNGIYHDVKSRGYSNNFFKGLMKYISGHILHEGGIEEGRDYLVDFCASQGEEPELFNCSGVNPELWLVKRSPSAKQSLLVARFSGDNGVKFDVPILLVNSDVVGQYTGVIKLKKKLSFEIVKDSEGNETWITVDKLKADNPNLSFVNTIGILLYEGEEDELNDLDEPSQKFIQRKNTNGKLANIGKPLLAVTANDMTRIHTVQSARAYETENGKTIRDYSNVALIGIQCAVGSEQFLSLLNEVRGDVLNSTSVNTEKRIISTKENRLNSDENTMTSAAAQSHDVKLIEKPTDKNNDKAKGTLYRQIISYNHAGQLIAGLLCTNNSAAQAALIYLAPDQKEIRGIEVNDDNKKLSFTISVVDGHYLTLGTLDNTGFHERKNSHRIDLNDPKYQSNWTLVFNELCESNELLNPRMNFKFASPWKSQGGYYIGVPETNYQLALALNSVKRDDRVNAVDTARKFIGWINGIYMDDHAIRQTVEGANSHYGVLETGGRTYVTNYTKVNYPVYSLSLGIDDVVPMDEPAPINPVPNPENTSTEQFVEPISSSAITSASTRQSLQDFLDAYHLGIKALTIEEANKLLKGKSKNWIYKYIEFDGEKYILKQTIEDEQNINNWMFYNIINSPIYFKGARLLFYDWAWENVLAGKFDKYGIFEVGIIRHEENPEAVNYIHCIKLKDNYGFISFNKEMSIAKEELLELAEQNNYYGQLIIKYASERLYSKETTDIIELLKLNTPFSLELSEKIANFEEEYTNAFKC